MKGALLYGQSGGPSPVINASAYGVLKQANEEELITKVYAMRHGISGAIEDDLISLESFINQLELLKNTPASAFGSVRHKMSHYEEDESEYIKIFSVFRKYNIRYFVYNGGNDSMDTCQKISAYAMHIGYDMKVFGVPKTVDNDLPNTDHTPGFGSAAKFIANTVAQIKLDSTVYPRGKVTIVEIMGRHAGWLTASADLASEINLGPDLVYLPEMVFDEEIFLNQVQEIYNKKHQCLIAVSEGIKDKDHNFIGSLHKMVDAFGHSQLGGVGLYLGDVIEEKLGIKYRSIELSTIQRSAAYVRSKTDVEEAVEVGRKAVAFMISGLSDKMVVIKRKSNLPYQVEYDTIDLIKVANMEKMIPESMYDAKTCKMKEEFFAYARPLISGEDTQIYKDGLLEFFSIK